MPKRLQVKPLKEACLHYITQNNAKYCWCADFPQHQPTFNGPFECLPPELREELWDVLVKTETLRMSHIPLFFHSNLTKLKLTFRDNLLNKNPTSVFKLLFVRCKKLKRLHVVQSYQIDLPDEIFYLLPTKLTNLTHLNVSDTSFNDQACAALSHYCTQLEELILQGTVTVTDRGMINLCSTKPGGVKKCTNLRNLNIHASGVSHEGVRVVLQNIPGLHYLTHPRYLPFAMAILHNDYKIGQILPREQQYQLRKINFEEFLGNLNGGLEPFKVTHVVHVVLAYCPNITELTLSCNATPGVWPILHALRGLQSLHLGLENAIEFSPCILPMLQVNGGTLRSLRLDFVSHVDLAVIGGLCPLLESLHIADTTMPKKYDPIFMGTDFTERKLMMYAGPFEDREGPISDIQMFRRNTCPDIGLIPAGNAKRFKHLTKFNIAIHLNANRDLDLSEVLMYSENLKCLVLSEVHELDDALLHEVLRVNPLKQLEVVELYECNRISGAAVSQLLLMENNLSQLELHACENVTKTDEKNMLKLMEEQGNMDIKIKFVTERARGNNGYLY